MVGSVGWGERGNLWGAQGWALCKDYIFNSKLQNERKIVRGRRGVGGSVLLESSLIAAVLWVRSRLAAVLHHGNLEPPEPLERSHSQQSCYSPSSRGWNLWWLGQQPPHTPAPSPRELGLQQEKAGRGHKGILIGWDILGNTPGGAGTAAILWKYISRRSSTNLRDTRNQCIISDSFSLFSSPWIS